MILMMMTMVMIIMVPLSSRVCRNFRNETSAGEVSVTMFVDMWVYLGVILMFAGPTVE